MAINKETIEGGFNEVVGNVQQAAGNAFGDTKMLRLGGAAVRSAKRRAQ